MLFTHNSSEQVVRAKWKNWFFEEKLAFWAISRAKSTKKWKPPQVNLNPDIEHQNAAKHCKITFYIVFIRYFDHKTHNEHVFTTFQVFVTCIFVFIDAQSFRNSWLVSDNLWSNSIFWKYPIPFQSIPIASLYYYHPGNNWFLIFWCTLCAYFLFFIFLFIFYFFFISYEK